MDVALSRLKGRALQIWQRFLTPISNRALAATFEEMRLRELVPLLRGMLWFAVIAWGGVASLVLHLAVPNPPIWMLLQHIISVTVLLISLVLAYTPLVRRYGDLIAAICFCAIVATILSAMHGADAVARMSFISTAMIVIVLATMPFGQMPWVGLAAAGTYWVGYGIFAIFVEPLSPMERPFGLVTFLTLALFVGLSVWRMRQSVRTFLRRASLEQERDQRQALEKQLMEERAANDVKSKFLAGMSHEIRTPLNAIIGFAETMRLQIFGPMHNDRYLDYAGLIETSGRHLLSLINDIVDMARLEAKSITLADEPVDPDAEIITVADMFEARLLAKQVTLTVRHLPGCPWLKSDERAFRQILINLLGNAVKHSPDGGIITLSVLRGEYGGLVIDISDQGPGVPDEIIGRLFQPFVAAGSWSATSGGSGLGLAITRGLMDAHGGTVGLTNNISGRGATARVIFPAERLLPPGTANA